MKYLIQRIIVNSHGWTRPSPHRLGPIGEGEYVQKNGFGHEDWNFNQDLARNEYLHGYAYYRPALTDRDDRFNIAFATYTQGQWSLIGFYLNATFQESGAPADPRVLRSKLKDILDLKLSRSLGKPWSGLSRSGGIGKLKKEARWVNWKVHIKDIIRLPQPVRIPKQIFDPTNFRLTKPTILPSNTFTALRTLARRTALLEDVDDDATFPEGREMLLKHKARERNPAVIKAAKRRFLAKHRRFYCQACGFDFEKAYGDIGSGFIEAHHTVPVSQLRRGSKTRIADIGLVCSNCHRMLHRRRPWIGISELRSLLSQSQLRDKVAREKRVN